MTLPADFHWMAFVAVMLSAVMHASWNAIVKIGGDRLSSMALIDTFCLLAALPFLLLVPLPAPAVWPFLLATVCLEVVYKLSLVAAYNRGDFSQAYPLMRGCAPMMVALLLLAMGSERLGPGGYAGIALICCGLVSLVRWRTQSPQLMGFALLAGACLAGGTVIDGTAVKRHGQVFSYIVWLQTLSHLFMPGYAAVRRGRTLLTLLRTEWKRAWIGGINRVGSYALMLWAMTLAPVAKLAALRESSVIFAALLGYFLLREPFDRRRLLATALVLAGIVTLQLAR
ncbi:EamA family transporter [Cupriavidus gilardii]|uniref:EamA family transporter n=1 Tax=Cupriavidus gilardii TaxID=82541 RepID=A0ABY4VS47_9BURK|nr:MULTISPECIES: EamA family transporter [Cupriavidus]ESJ25571.1 membrane protein [Cupriavidus sp. HPC(L)]MCT9115804.1 EamA family transporter [Cupriavidus gilardii]MCT9124366.1 EamA family transporter [Cupriavidus gilardii]USE78173.1 EamA family transporter [Cupriavidus gilardii]